MVAVAEAGVRGTGGCPRREGCWAGAVTPSAWPRNKPRKAIPAARRRVIAPEWEAAVRDGERPWRTPRGVGMIWAPAGGGLRYARATGGASPAGGGAGGGGAGRRAGGARRGGRAGGVGGRADRGRRSSPRPTPRERGRGGRARGAGDRV